jgi:SAM-dependent methyltransferase
MQLRSWDSYYSQETTLQASAASLIYHWPYIWQVHSKARHSAIEIGCGRGLHSIFLSCFIRNVLGIDDNIKLIERARKNNSKFRGHAQFLVRDAFQLDFPPETFDVCFSQGFLEHFTNEEIRLLTEKQLRIANVMVASVPSAFYAVRDRGDERLLPMEDWRRIFKDFDAHAFYYGFKPREFNQIISVKNLWDITRIVSSMSGKAHICMVVKKANN